MLAHVRVAKASRDPIDPPHFRPTSAAAIAPRLAPVRAAIGPTLAIRAPAPDLEQGPHVLVSLVPSQERAIVQEPEIAPVDGPTRVTSTTFSASNAPRPAPATSAAAIVLADLAATGSSDVLCRPPLSLAELVAVTDLADQVLAKAGIAPVGPVAEDKMVTVLVGLAVEDKMVTVLLGPVVVDKMVIAPVGPVA
jgi:hypothetical protein